MYANLSASAKGSLCMIGGTFLLTTQDGITKWLTTDYHAGEILFYRGIGTFLPILVLVWYGGGWRTLRSGNLPGSLVRGGFALATSLFVVLSFVQLPLADALALIFISPILLTALSVPLLRESVGWRRWSAVFVGFFGVLFMVQPGEGGWQYFLAFPLIAACLSAGRDIVTRHLRTADTSLSMLFYSMLISLLGGAVTLPFGTHFPSLGEWALFLIAGVLNSLAHLLSIQALLMAPAATVAPFRYLSLVWAAFIGYLVWGDVPDSLKIVGAVLVVGAGLYILHRETRPSRRPRPTG